MGADGAVQDSLRSGRQQDDRPALLHQSNVLAAHGHAAAAGDNHRLTRLQMPQQPCLAFAEIRFALLLKDVGDLHMFVVLDHLIRIPVIDMEQAAEAAGDCALAHAHKTNQKNVSIHLLPPEI